MKYIIIFTVFFCSLPSICMRTMERTDNPEKDFIPLNNNWRIDREHMNSVLSSANSYFEKTNTPQLGWKDKTIIHFFASCTKDCHEEMLNLLVTEKVTNMKHIEQMSTTYPQARKLLLGNLRASELIENYRNTERLQEK